MTRLLVIIDMQNDFVTGVLGSDEAAAIVGSIKEKAEAYISGGNPVLFTMDTHREQDYEGAVLSLESAMIPKHCIEGDDGWRLVPALEPLAEGKQVKKPTFLSPTLAQEIRDRYGSELEIELCGVCTDICVVSNALALRAEFPQSMITVDGSCCAGTTPENHAAALAVMKSCLIKIQ